MAFIDESHSTIDSKAVVITFHCWDDSLPVYILTSVNNWDPILMTKDKESSTDDNHRFQHTVVVREEVSSIHYKFRIGDSYYLHDDSAPTVSDGFGGSNNTFLISWTPKVSLSAESTPLIMPAGTDTPGNNMSIDSANNPAPVTTPNRLPDVETITPTESTDAAHLHTSAVTVPPISETKLEYSKNAASDSQLDIRSTTPTLPSNGHVLTPTTATGEQGGQEASEPSERLIVDDTKAEVKPAVIQQDEDANNIVAVDEVAKSENHTSEEPVVLSDKSETEATGAPTVPYTKTTLWANAEEAAMKQLIAEPAESSDTDIVLDAREELDTGLQQSRSPIVYAQALKEPIGFDSFKMPLIFFAIVVVLIAVWLAFSGWST